MSGLPSGWVRVNLDEIAEVQGGIQKQQKRRPVDNKFPFLRVANVASGALDLREVHEVELFEGELERFALRAGDLLVVEGNGSVSQLGRAARWNGEIENCVHQNHLIRVRPGPAISAKFLELLWNSPAVSEQLRGAAASTSGLHTLSTAKLKRVSIALPPLEEQRRIVAALEEQLSRLDAGEKSLGDAGRRIALTVRSLLNQYLGSSGVRTRGWQYERLGDVADIRGGQTPRKNSVEFYTEWTPGLIPFWKVGDMNGADGRLMARSRTYLSAEQIASARVKTYPAGTVLLPKRGGAIATNKKRITSIVGAFDLNVMGVVPNKGLVSKFLWYWFQTIDLNELSDGSNVPQINKPDLSHLLIPVPSEAEQKSVVRHLDDLLTRFDRIQSTISDVQPNWLRASLLQQAFAGRLVPRNPADEPAEALLARIRAEREAAGVTKGRRRAPAQRKRSPDTAPLPPHAADAPALSAATQPTLDLEIPS
ncbi:restriction endonuclease subunit S [Streptomyces griseoluteus]|uniref:restriction endonuclease subunit S n=1 Tax=Streptomyces griseoluteus TaxID=29306 RepID=UPI003702CFC9